MLLLEGLGDRLLSVVVVIYMPQLEALEPTKAVAYFERYEVEELIEEMEKAICPDCKRRLKARIIMDLHGFKMKFLCDCLGVNAITKRVLSKTQAP